MNTIILIGGAGYVGLHLSEYLLENTDYSIIIVSRNRSKRLLVRDKRVAFANSITEISVKGIVINLAFENSANFSLIRKSSFKLFNDIKYYNETVGIKFFVQLSTIALSEVKSDFCVKNTANPYLYCKSIQEYLSLKNFKKSNTCIVRAGNIIGNDSPWITKIADKIIGDAPLISAEFSGSSNATHITFLCKTLLDLVRSEQQGQFNCSELSDISWHRIIQELCGGIRGGELSYFEEPLDKPISFFVYLKSSILAFIIRLQGSPEYASFFNKLVSFGPLSVLKEKVRQSEKFRLPSLTVSDMLVKEHKLFCNSVRVESDFCRDYDENKLINELITGLNKMGYK